jgi:hypothetical protein
MLKIATGHPAEERGLQAAEMRFCTQAQDRRGARVGGLFLQPEGRAPAPYNAFREWRQYRMLC